MIRNNTLRTIASSITGWRVVVNCTQTLPATSRADALSLTAALRGHFHIVEAFRFGVLQFKSGQCIR